MTALIICKAWKVIAGNHDPTGINIRVGLFILLFYLHRVPSGQLFKDRAVFDLAPGLIPHTDKPFP